MSAWRPNFHWITHELAVGGSFASEHVARLADEHGIGAVVDLRNEDRDDEQLLRAHGITLLHLPTEDMCGVEAPHLAQGVALRLRADRPRRARADPLPARHRPLGRARPVRDGAARPCAAAGAGADEGPSRARVALARPVRVLVRLARAASPRERRRLDGAVLRRVREHRLPAPDAVDVMLVYGDVVRHEHAATKLERTCATLRCDASGPRWRRARGARRRARRGRRAGAGPCRRGVPCGGRRGSRLDARSHAATALLMAVARRCALSW